jgi:phosphoglycerate dehydrogenase-like enzyme
MQGWQATSRTAGFLPFESCGGVTMNDPFHVGVSADFKTEAAGLLEPVLDEMFGPLPYVEYEFFDFRKEVVAPDEIASYDAAITLHPHFTASTFSGDDRLAIIARWGVGYDMIDVPACTEANVLLAITVDAVRKPVAEAILMFFLALAKKLPAKDRLVRTGHWDLKAEASGLGLSGKTAGSVGMGNIGGEMFRLLRPFDLGRLLAFDPYVTQEQAAQLGVELVDLPTLFKESDFVAINCPLNGETEGMINAELLSLMKPTAYLVNAARGPIVDQAALTAALQDGRIAGAGLDVFEQEPLPIDDPLTELDNVILAPHAIAWTDDLYRGNGVGACQNVLTILKGEVPKYTVNKEVVEQPGFQAKLKSLRDRWTALAE